MIYDFYIIFFHPVRAKYVAHPLGKGDIHTVKGSEGAVFGRSISSSFIPHLIAS